MNEIVFDTKVYQPTPLKNRVLIIVLNIALGIVAIISLVSIFLVGINVANISAIIVSIVVVFGTKNRLKSENEYLDCYGKAELTNGCLEIKYYKYNANGNLIDEFIEVIVRLNEIQTLEYSDILKCLRLTGNITYKEQSEDIKYVNEHLLYVEAYRVEHWILELQRQTNLVVRYVDRVNTII